MNPYFRRVGTSLIQFGIDPRRLIASIRFAPLYLFGFYRFWRSMTHSVTVPFPIRWLPVLSDRYMSSGVAKGHYFHQDLWAARHIYSRKPRRHVDVGSRIDGFVGHLLVFRDVEVLDVRQLQSKVSGLSFRQADLMRAHYVEPGSTDSLSCLHALEHFGLGRYGDPIDVDGWHTGFKNLTSMLCPGGRLYLSVPVGTQVIEFNAQRIFAPITILSAAQTFGLNLVEFSHIDDAGDFHEQSSIDMVGACDYSCGCFIFERPA